MLVDIERRLLELLKRVQNRQYDDQRGTSLTAFKEMPDFLRESNNNDFEQQIGDEEFSEKCALDESRVEVCRHRDVDKDLGLHLSLSPTRCLQQNATFSDEDDLPSHESAEQYFSCSSRAVASPDYSDPRLMEKSLRDIGMESPSGTRSWRLVGNIADNPSVSPAKEANDTFVFAVPSLPPLKLYRRRVSTPQLMTARETEVPARGSSLECLAQKPADQPLTVDTSVGQNELSDSSTTPSPTTHDLVLVDRYCVVATSNRTGPVTHNSVAPIVDPEDSGEEFGIV